VKAELSGELALTAEPAIDLTTLLILFFLAAPLPLPVKVVLYFAFLTFTLSYLLRVG
jgi:hypothetical protein